MQFLMIDNVEDLCDYKGFKRYSYVKQCCLSNIFHNSLGSGKYCLLKSDCCSSERLRDSSHKLWICLSKREEKVITAHCTCILGGVPHATMWQQLYSVQRQKWNLNITIWHVQACEWIPNRKDVQPAKIKDLNFNRNEFAQRGKKRKKMLWTLYNLLINNNQKLF